MNFHVCHGAKVGIICGCFCQVVAQLAEIKLCGVVSRNGEGFHAEMSFTQTCLRHAGGAKETKGATREVVFIEIGLIK